MFLSSHHINLCKIEIENIISRRIERLLDILRSNKKVLFIFCNEHAIYRKDFRDKTKLYYEQLKEISNILKQKFKINYFTILFIIIDYDDQQFKNTDTITVCKIKWDKNLLSDNEEIHGLTCDIFRNKAQIEIENFLK